MKPNEQNPSVTAPSKAGDQTQPARAEPKQPEFGKPFTPGPAKEEVKSPLLTKGNGGTSEYPQKST
jgi:hypothetical protein